VADLYHLVIRELVAEPDATLHLYSAYHDLEYATPANSILQPADSPLVTAVGAVPYYSPSTIEPFSSLGPTTDGRIKPDITAPDGVGNATFGNFFGTSAASPHAAGAAALVLQRLPCLTAVQLGASLQSLVVDLGPAGKDNTFGEGRLSLGAAPSDPDGDGLGEPCDNCPSWFNPGQTLPVWQVPVADSDCDGFPDSSPTGPPLVRAAEAFIGTLPTQQCAATSTANDEALPDMWPVDLNDSRSVTGPDLLAFSPVFGGGTPEGPPYNERFDLHPDGRITGPDLLKFGPFFGQSCT
jgi:hypothetical protein